MRFVFLYILATCFVFGRFSFVCDNATVVRHAQRLIAGGTHAKTHGWTLTSDGDLWEIAHNCIEHKGRHAIRVSKLKGHATSDDVQAGTISEGDRRGNMLSDTLAQHATDTDQGDRIHICYALLRRRTLYAAFTEKVQALIRRVLRADADMRARPARAVMSCARSARANDAVRPPHGPRYF